MEWIREYAVAWELFIWTGGGGGGGGGKPKKGAPGFGPLICPRNKRSLKKVFVGFGPLFFPEKKVFAGFGPLFCPRSN